MYFSVLYAYVGYFRGEIFCRCTLVLHFTRKIFTNGLIFSQILKIEIFLKILKILKFLKFLKHVISICDINAVINFKNFEISKILKIEKILKIVKIENFHKWLDGLA